MVLCSLLGASLFEVELVRETCGPWRGVVLGGSWRLEHSPHARSDG
jgi:hypothetical protein